MKKIIAEFKKFITRGNIVDMAVGVIVGSSFTAIVNALSNNILKPVINWLLALIFGANSLSEVYTFLKKVEVDGAVDLAQSIYIDWGAFINAIINFFIVATVLFAIVKLVNMVREKQKKAYAEMLAETPTRADRKAMKAAGIKRFDTNAIKAYMKEKKAKADKKAAEEKAEAEEKARLEKLANPSTEELLKQILEVIKERKTEE